MKYMILISNKVPSDTGGSASKKIMHFTETNQSTKYNMHINKMLGKDNSNIPQGNMDVLDKHNHIYINAETGIMLDYPFGEKDPVVNSRMDNRWGQMDEKTDWKPPQETVLPERDTVGFHDEAYKNWDGSTVPIIMVRW